MKGKVLITVMVGLLFLSFLSSIAEAAPGGLPECTNSLNTCGINLGACTNNLNVCTTILGACTTGLAQAQTNMATCEANAQACQANLATCLEAAEGTPISSLPFTINTSGSYYLTGNLTSTGSGIWVDADDVTIDFKGFTITGPRAGINDGVRIAAKNVEVKNGTVKNFSNGIIFVSLVGQHRVINMRAVENSYYGIDLPNDSHMVRDCSAIGNGNQGIIAGNGSVITGNVVNYNGHGGILSGDGSIVIGNTAFNNGVTGLVGPATGINAGAGSTIKNNTAYGNRGYGIDLVGYNIVDGNTAYGNIGYANIGPCATCAFGTNVAP